MGETRFVSRDYAVDTGDFTICSCALEDTSRSMILSIADERLTAQKKKFVTVVERRKPVDHDRESGIKAESGRQVAHGGTVVERCSDPCIIFP